MAKDFATQQWADNISCMSNPNLPVLRGERVTLRRAREEDVEARLKLGTDAEILRMYGGSRGDVRPMNREAAKRWVRWLLDHDHAWVIETDALIGHIRLDRVDLKDRRASLAIGIEDPARLGIGLGREAMVLVLEYAFNVLKLHRVSVRVVDYNQRAIRAYRRCGFVVEGRQREAALVDGDWHDDVMMAILDREFEAIRRGKG